MPRKEVFLRTGAQQPAPSESDEQLAQLTAQVEKTREAYNACVSRLHEVLNEGIGALPHPDGMLRSQQVVQAYRKALREYTDATMKMNGHILDLSKPRTIEDEIPAVPAQRQGQQYRLNAPTIAVASEDGKDRIVQVPIDATILVRDSLTESKQPNRQVFVHWMGKDLLMFTVDILERGEKL
jgi:hypothetical protein